MVVVMAIVAMLAALLLPVLMGSREQGRRAKCISNLQQISEGIAIYCNNTNDYLPSCYNYGYATVDKNGNQIEHGDTVEGIHRAISGIPGDPDWKTTFGGHQGLSRHTVVGYSFATTDIATDLRPMPWPELWTETVIREKKPPPGFVDTDGTFVFPKEEVEIIHSGPMRYNFAPNGLGLLLDEAALDDADVFNCPSMSGEVNTYFGYSTGAGQNIGNKYIYDPAAWKKLRVKAKETFAGDGRELHHTPIDAFDPNGPTVTALLSSYSYRNTPFFYQEDHYDKDHPLVLDSLKIAYKPPLYQPEFMVPLFKTRRTLADRAIVSDSFDYAQPDKADWFQEGRGMSKFCHKDGYNVLYGDGHVKWYEDPDDLISNWHDTDPANPRWLDPAHAGTDNLTISSPTSQKVWNLFDNAAGIDVQ
jgi:prepilin-type processing-associated H-X9-DG protein